MVSVWFWKFIRLHFSLYYNISKCPVTWNSTTRLFKFEFKNTWQYKTFYFLIFFVLGVLVQGSLISVCVCYFINLITLSQVNIGIVVIFMLFSGTIYVAFLIAAFIPYFGRDEVYALNNMLELDKNLESVCKIREFTILSFNNRQKGNLKLS